MSYRDHPVFRDLPVAAAHLDAIGASPTVATFKVGQEYAVRSLCDWDCIFRFTVVARTAKFVTLRHGNAEGTLRVGVKVWNHAETVKPFGSYSMAPTLNAEGDRLLPYQEGTS